MTTTTETTETLESFLASRAGWLRVETVDRPRGGWDVVLRIDGTYYGGNIFSEDDRANMVGYLRERLLPLLLNAGIDRLEGWNEPVKS
jgi:hypothetical protein